MFATSLEVALEPGALLDAMDGIIGALDQLLLVLWPGVLVGIAHGDMG